MVVFLVVSCGEQGQARASARDLVGNYATDFNTGKELLSLNAHGTFVQVFNGTFVQVFTSTKSRITTRGKWHLDNEFLGATEVLLEGNLASEDDDKNSQPIYGQRSLIVHREQGKLKLALNETSDWFYDRAN